DAVRARQGLELRAHEPQRHGALVVAQVEPLGDLGVERWVERDVADLGVAHPVDTELLRLGPDLDVAAGPELTALQVPVTPPAVDAVRQPLPVAGALRAVRHVAETERAPTSPRVLGGAQAGRRLDVEMQVRGDDGAQLHEGAIEIRRGPGSDALE